MELKDFIVNVFKDVIDGVVESQEYAKTKGAIIAPAYRFLSSEKGEQTVHTNTDSIGPRKINFNITLADVNSTSKSGGIGVLFGDFNIGSKKEKSESNKYGTQISFSIPFFPPRQK